MKNHEWVDGRLLQANKKWSQLKERQKTWIYEMAKKEYDRFVTEHNKQPVHGAKKALIERVYDQITEREIWVPFAEVSRVLSPRIAHWNRATPRTGMDAARESAPMDEKN